MDIILVHVSQVGTLGCHLAPGCQLQNDGSVCTFTSMMDIQNRPSVQCPYMSIALTMVRPLLDVQAKKIFDVCQVKQGVNRNTFVS